MAKVPRPEKIQNFDEMRDGDPDYLYEDGNVVICSKGERHYYYVGRDRIELFITDDLEDGFETFWEKRCEVKSLEAARAIMANLPETTEGLEKEGYVAQEL